MTSNRVAFRDLLGNPLVRHVTRATIERWRFVFDDAIAHLDLADGGRDLFALPPGDAVSEPIFVPRAPNASEGEGWLLTVAWRAEERRSDLLVLDAGALAGGPIAVIQLSHRVPFGFHGNWRPGA